MKTIKLNEEDIRKIVKSIISENYAKIRHAHNGIRGELDNMYPDDYQALSAIDAGKLENGFISIQKDIDSNGRIVSFNDVISKIDDGLHNTVTQYLPIIRACEGFDKYLKEVQNIINYLTNDEYEEDY